MGFLRHTHPTTQSINPLLMLFMRLFSLFLIANLSLTACGFHLRGSYHIPLQLKN
jgi:hypothetical protein